MTYGQPPYGGQGGSGNNEYGQPQGWSPANGQGYPPAYPAAGGYPGYVGQQPNPGAQDPQDLTLPLYGATFGQGVSRFFRNYVNFSGRASKSEYWWPLLATFLVFLVLGILVGVVSAAAGDGSGAGIAGILLLLVGLALALPSISVSVRRLHDANLSGWLYLLSFVPFVNYFAWIVFGLLSTNPAGARFDRR